MMMMMMMSFTIFIYKFFIIVRLLFSWNFLNLEWISLSFFRLLLNWIGSLFYDKVLSWSSLRWFYTRSGCSYWAIFRHRRASDSSSWSKLSLSRFIKIYLFLLTRSYFIGNCSILIWHNWVWGWRIKSMRKSFKKLGSSFNWRRRRLIFSLEVTRLGSILSIRIQSRTSWN